MKMPEYDLFGFSESAEITDFNVTLTDHSNNIITGIHCLWLLEDYHIKNDLC